MKDLLDRMRRNRSSEEADALILISCREKVLFMFMEKRSPYHFVACAYPVHNSKVLLVNNRKLRAWLPPGGHIRQSDEKCYYLETPEEAAIREVKEETSLDIHIVEDCYQCRPEDTERFRILPRFLYLHSIDREHDHLGFEYFAKIVGDEKQPKSSEEGECRWFSMEELDNFSSYQGVEIPSDVRKIAKEAIKKLS